MFGIRSNKKKLGGQKHSDLPLNGWSRINRWKQVWDWHPSIRRLSFACGCLMSCHACIFDSQKLFAANGREGVATRRGEAAGPFRAAWSSNITCRCRRLCILQVLVPPPSAAAFALVPATGKGKLLCARDTWTSAKASIIGMQDRVHR